MSRPSLPIFLDDAEKSYSAAAIATHGPNGGWSRPVAAALGSLLIGIGIGEMQRSVPGPFANTLFDNWLTTVAFPIFPNPEWIFVGSVLVLLGMLTAAFGLFGALPPDSFSFQPSSPGPIAAASRRAISSSRPRTIVLLGGLALCAVAALHAPGHTAGLIDLGALLLGVIVVGLALWNMSPGQAMDVRLTRWDLLFVFAVIGAYIAINMRDVTNWLYAFVGDEWAFYDAAKVIAQGQQVDVFSQFGVYGIHATMDSLYQGAVMRVFGENVVGWRLSCVLASGLAIVPLFWLGWRMGGRTVAYAAALVYAAASVLWAYNHIGYNEMDPLLYIVPAAAFLYAALESDAAGAFYAAGACAGAAWYTLFTGRLMIGIIVLVVLTRVQGGLRSVARRLGFLLLGFGLVVLPLVLDNGADTIKQMFSLVSMSQARTSTPAGQLFVDNTKRALYEFFYGTESAHYVQGAIVDLVTAAALCLGLVVCLRTPRSFSARLLLIWFVVSLALTTPLYYVPQIADTRVQILYPSVALLAGLGLTALARTLSRRLPSPPRRWVYRGTLALPLAAVWLLNLNQFYNVRPGGVAESDLAAYVGVIQAHPQMTILLAGQSADVNLCQVLDGYSLGQAYELGPSNTGLTPACPFPPTTGAAASIPRHSRALVLLGPSQGPGLLQTCAAAHLSPLIVAPNGATGAFGYIFAVDLHARSTYAATVARQALALCPAIGGLTKP